MKKEHIYAFVCCTPYQVLNTLNFVINNIEDCKEHSDIFVCCGYRNMKKIADKLKKINIFNNVYVVSEYRNAPQGISVILAIIRLLFPHKAIKRHLLYELDLKKAAYDRLVISVVTFFSMNLIDYCKIKEVYFLEDGTFSYMQRDLKNANMSRKFVWFCNLIHRGLASFEVTKLFLNNVEMYKGGFEREIIQLPRLAGNNEVIQSAKIIFNYKQNDFYQQNKIVYLTQPLSKKTEEILHIEQCIMNVLEKYHINRKLVVRVHPVQKQKDYIGWRTDENDNLWELECITQINDEHILIGEFSTAQFAPKFLLDKEPYIIFLFRLLSGENTFGREYVIDSLIKGYKNPGKIFIPQSVEEFSQILIKLEPYE